MCVNTPSQYRDPLGLHLDLSQSNSDVNNALARIITTRRGLELFKALIADSRACRIIAIPGAGKAYAILGTCDVFIDPQFNPRAMTTVGRKAASTERVLEHEMGHATTGIGDTGPGRMDNIILNEDPGVTELGFPARIAY